MLMVQTIVPGYPLLIVIQAPPRHLDDATAHISGYWILDARDSGHMVFTVADSPWLTIL
jgi:hypothetical protein